MPDVFAAVSSPDATWAARQRHWARKLGRLQLGAEPLDVQLARYRRATWGGTAVSVAIGLMFVGLFAAFGRAGLGAIAAGVLVVPWVAIAWLDLTLLSRRVAAYERERREHDRPQPR